MSAPVFKPGETQTLTIVRDDLNPGKWNFKIGSSTYKSVTTSYGYAQNVMNGIETNNTASSYSGQFIHDELQVYVSDPNLGNVWKRWGTGVLEEVPSNSPLNIQWVNSPYSLKTWY